ncbi:MAG: hypothetical protein CMH57_15885 [Myxococcales bacterium]|nr:hypothetical protein [Myxococcales bacterium]
MTRWLTLVAALAALAGCAQAHQVQLGEVDSRAVVEGRRFEILVSETGVNVQQAAEIGGALVSSQAGNLSTLGDIIAMFQMGPATGNPVFREEYADAVLELIRAECPSGRITGLTSIRESASYPVVSGEVIKVVGYCVEEGR